MDVFPDSYAKNIIFSVIFQSHCTRASSTLVMKAIKNIKMVVTARTEAARMLDENPDLARCPAARDILVSEKQGVYFE